ncbi:MAG: hypothetical protein RH917_00755 [Lacipirellulaceae bacterium]
MTATKFSIILSTLAFFVFSSPSNASTLLTAGIEDGFAAPTEAANPSANFLATVPATPGVNAGDFDEVSANRNTLHTFDGLPAGIVSATLRFRVQGNPSVNATGNGGDGIILAFSDSDSDDLADDLVWSRTFGSTGSNGALFVDNDPGLLTSGIWSGTSNEAGILDLSALPLAGGGTLDLIPLLNSNGFLDILSGDDSTTDFFELAIEVPEPTSFALLSLSALSACLRRLRVR